MSRRYASACTLLMWALCACAESQEWIRGFERAEQFLPLPVSRLVTGVGEEQRIQLRWAADESSAEWIDSEGRLRRLELPSGKIVQLAAGTRPSPAPAVEDRVASPDRRFSVVARDHNLFVQSQDGMRQLTFDGELWRTFNGRYARSNPLAEPAVHAIPPLVRFLGHGSWFVAERWDFRRVSSIWLANSLRSPRPASIEQRMAYPGDRDIPLPELWLIDAASGERRLLPNEGWAYVGNMDVGAGGIFPSPDGRFLYFVRMSRGYERVELCRVELPHGNVTVVWREESKPYFTIRSPEVAFVGRSEEMVWKSDRDGRAHYYLLNARTGQLIRRLTHGQLTAARVLHVDAVSRMLYFEAYGDGAGGDPNYAHGFRVSLDGGPLRQLDSEEATHTFTPSPSAHYFLDTFSTVAEAPRTVLRNRSGHIVTQLGTANIAPLVKTGWRPPERISIRAADGETRLYGVLWKPFAFDPSRRYPVIVSVYPGPSYDGVPTRFEPGHHNSALAQLGFIVVSIGTRGSSSIRGTAYQTYARAFGDSRDYALDDLREAVESLANKRPWMDLERVGVVGHSGGGFMAVAAMLHDPGFYKAGVACSGNHDNTIYEMNSSEFYWGDPRAAITGGGARYATNLERADRLAGALLLMHGETDDDVSLAHTMRLVDALMRAGKLFDLLVLPGRGHEYGYPDAPAAEYTQRRLWRHFVEHLHPDAPNSALAR